MKSQRRVRRVKGAFVVWCGVVCGVVWGGGTRRGRGKGWCWGWEEGRGRGGKRGQQFLWRGGGSRIPERPSRGIIDLPTWSHSVPALLRNFHIGSSQHHWQQKMPSNIFIMVNNASTIATPGRSKEKTKQSNTRLSRHSTLQATRQPKASPTTRHDTEESMAERRTVLDPAKAKPPTPRDVARSRPCLQWRRAVHEEHRDKLQQSTSQHHHQRKNRLDLQTRNHRLFVGITTLYLNFPDPTFA